MKLKSTFIFNEPAGDFKVLYRQSFNPEGQKEALVMDLEGATSELTEGLNFELLLLSLMR